MYLHGEERDFTFFFFFTIFHSVLVTLTRGCLKYGKILILLRLCSRTYLILRRQEQRNILHEIRKRKANWIGHILHRNCLLQRVFEGKIKGVGG
jgi:hypothetical protein